MGVGLGPRGGTLASPTQSPAPPALRERVGQDDHGPTPLRANSHSTTRHAATAHSDAQPHAPTRRLVYAPTSPSLVVFRLQPLGAGWEGEKGDGDRGPAGCAGFRTGRPSGGRGNHCRWLRHRHPAPTGGKNAANRGKRAILAPGRRGR